MDNQANTNDSAKDEYLLPSRSVVHPTPKGKFSRLFYSTIVILFILLIITLIMLFLYNNKH